MRILRSGAADAVAARGLGKGFTQTQPCAGRREARGVRRASGRRGREPGVRLPRPWPAIL